MMPSHLTHSEVRMVEARNIETTPGMVFDVSVEGNDDGPWC